MENLPLQFLTYKGSNPQLWQLALAFDLDQPASEYGFSLRLAKENHWSQRFTELAILEYKKFMYLAATSSQMVSPSPIVDVVWHQHLIFSKSYNKFCKMLGKQIQHIPSTHDKKEHAVFEAAKQRTHELYLQSFGEQPKLIWEFENLFASLGLKKARIKLGQGILLALLAMVGLFIFAFPMLKPLYLQIKGIQFIGYFLALLASTLVGLEICNRLYLNAVAKKLIPKSFLSLLSPSELIFLRWNKQEEVINSVLSNMLSKGQLQISSTKTIEKNRATTGETHEEKAIHAEFEGIESMQYHRLTKAALTKPAFTNTFDFFTAFDKYLKWSRKFRPLIFGNLFVLASVFGWGVGRLVLGILNHKPTGILVLVLVGAAIGIALYMAHLMRLFTHSAIPKQMKQAFKTTDNINMPSSLDYFLDRGKTKSTLAIAIAASSAHYGQEKSNHFASSCTTSCGSSCGGGGGCGGCGGD